MCGEMRFGTIKAQAAAFFKLETGGDDISMSIDILCIVHLKKMLPKAILSLWNKTHNML